MSIFRPIPVIGTLVIAFLSVSQAGAQPVQLEYRWSPGESTRYELTESMRQHLSGPIESELKWQRTLGYTERLLEQTDQGTRIERVYEGLTVSVSRDREPPVRFDSRAPDPESAKNLFIAPFVGLAGKSIRFTLLKNGSVADVEGAAEAIQAMFLPLEQGPLAPGLHAANQSPSQSDRLARQIEQALRIIPGKSVLRGERWPVEIDHATPLSSSLSSDIVATYTGIDRSTGNAAITLDGSLNQQVDDDNPDLSGLLGITLESSDLSGTLLFDAENGQIASSTMQLTTAWAVGGGLVQGEKPMRQRIEQHAELKRRR